MTRTRALVVGDVVDDILVLPTTAIRPDTDSVSVIRSSPGGSAANVAAWLGSLGMPVDFVGTVGTADLGRHADALRRHGVEPYLVGSPDLATSTIVIIVEGDRRTMLTERGANAALRAEHVTAAQLRTARLLHLTGYGLHDGLGEPGFATLVDRAHHEGIPVSVNPGSAGFIADYGAPAFGRAIAGADLLIANLEEGRLLAGETDPDRVIAALAARHPTVVLTLGAAGVLVAEPGTAPVTLESEAAIVIDPTGAGDALTAGFLACWADERDTVAAARAGIRTAGRALGLIGARPSLPGTPPAPRVAT